MRWLFVFLTLVLLGAADSSAARRTRLPAAAPTATQIPTPLPVATPFPTATPPPIVQVATPNPVLEFQKSLAEQSKDYQEFLRSETDRQQSFLKTVFALIVSAFGLGFFAFLGLLWKAFHEASKQIEGQFKAKGETLFAAKTAELEGEIAAFRKRVDEQLQAVATRATQNLNLNIEISAKIGQVAALLGAEGTNDPAKLRDLMLGSAIADMQELQRKIPNNRTVAIFTGRVYRFKGQLTEAVQALQRCIEHREKDGLDYGADQAALYYNKACYLSLRARTAKNPAEQEGLRREAWEALEKDVALDPSDLAEAQLDPDLTDLVQPPKRTWETLKRKSPADSHQPGSQKLS